MSYDFYADLGDERYADPYFTDNHPAFADDGMAGNVVVTAQGYARCGNYTSNVSGMWTRCLTAALDSHPNAREWIDADRKAFNATGRTVVFFNDGGERITGPYPLTGKLSLRDLAGQRMGDIAPLLRSAVEWGVGHVEELREANPKNGWGNAEGAVTYLWDIARFCDEHPHARLGLSS